MNLERDDTVHAHRFKERRDVTRGNWIPVLGLAILPRAAQVGHDGRLPSRACIPERAQKEEQPAQFVIDALTRLGDGLNSARRRLMAIGAQTTS